MELVFGTPKSSGGAVSSVKMADGVFVSNGIVTSAQLCYNCKERESSLYVDDIALRMKLKVEGLSFEKDLYIAGQWKRTKTPQGGMVISGAGSAFRVMRVFDELGIEGKVELPQGTIPQKYADRIVGQRLWFLDYAAYIKATGGTGYQTYPLVAAPYDGEKEEDVPLRLYELFKTDVERGYVKNFHPEYANTNLQESGASGDGMGDIDFNFGANVSDMKSEPW